MTTNVLLFQEGMKRAEEKGSDLKFSYMFWLPFMAVFREGIETVIFLAGTSSNYEVSEKTKIASDCHVLGLGA